MTRHEYEHNPLTRFDREMPLHTKRYRHYGQHSFSLSMAGLLQPTTLERAKNVFTTVIRQHPEYIFLQGTQLSLLTSVYDREHLFERVSAEPSHAISDWLWQSAGNRPLSSYSPLAARIAERTTLRSLQYDIHLDDDGLQYDDYWNRFHTGYLHFLATESLNDFQPFRLFLGHMHTAALEAYVEDTVPPSFWYKLN